MKLSSIAAALTLALAGCSRGDIANIDADAVYAEKEIPMNQRFIQEPEFGSCRMPSKIEGAKLLRLEAKGPVYLGWWSHCTEGNFVFVPLVPGKYPASRIYSIETGPANLTCFKLSDEDAQKRGSLASYLCDDLVSSGQVQQVFDVAKVVPVTPSVSEDEKSI